MKKRRSTACANPPAVLAGVLVTSCAPSHAEGAGLGFAWAPPGGGFGFLLERGALACAGHASGVQRSHAWGGALSGVEHSPFCGG